MGVFKKFLIYLYVGIWSTPYQFYLKIEKRERHNYCFLETNNPKSYALSGRKLSCNYEGTIGIS